MSTKETLPQAPAEAHGDERIAELLFEIDDHIARMHGDDRGGYAPVNELRAILASNAQPNVQPKGTQTKADELAARLRIACRDLRRKSYSLSDLIPLIEQAADALQAPAPAHANGCWTVISPTGQVFTGESPFRAANAANKQWVKTDPEAAQRFTDMIERMRAENEAENARLLAEHGTLNCPTCGGSGHIGDVQAPAVGAVPLTDEQIRRGFRALDDAETVRWMTAWQVWNRAVDWTQHQFAITASHVPVQGSQS